MDPTSRRHYVNEPNVFYYACGQYTLKHSRKAINNFLKSAYFAYVKVVLRFEHRIFYVNFAYTAFSPMDEQQQK